MAICLAANNGDYPVVYLGNFVKGFNLFVKGHAAILAVSTSIKREILSGCSFGLGSVSEIGYSQWSIISVRCCDTVQ